MSRYGAHWKIGGVTAAFVTRGEQNGQYRVLFERAYAELPDIEGIDWSRPVIEHLTDAGELGLPEGYGFTVEDITYSHAAHSYTVTIQTARQYLGDVTGYQAQLADARTQAQAAETALAARRSALADAYTRGVESYG